MEFIILIIGFISFFVGIGFIFGGQWAWTIANIFLLFIHSQPMDPFPGTTSKKDKKSNLKSIGAIMTLVGLLALIYSIPRL